MARKFSFFKILKNCQFSKLHIFQVIKYLPILFLFLLDITCTPVPANELVSIWCNLDRVSILVSILHLSLDLRKNCKASTMKMLKI